MNIYKINNNTNKYLGVYNYLKKNSLINSNYLKLLNIIYTFEIYILLYNDLNLIHYF